MLTFFTAFNYLEASPPSLVGRFCDADAVYLMNAAFAATWLVFAAGS